MQLIQHIQTRALNPASVQKKWRRKEMDGLLSRSFARDLVPTDQELSILFGDTRTDRQTDKVPAKTSANVQTDTRTRAKVERQTKARTKTQSTVLVFVMVVCASVSLSNMYDIAGQIKDNQADATLITALFSLAPFAMLYAGVSQWSSWIMSGICIAFEVFCNTAGMYRGLAGLGTSGKPYEVWEPGGFIDTVSRVTTLEPRPCALAISIGMAAIVAAVFLTCLIELKRC